MFSLFILPRVLRGPSADRRETSPHNRNLAKFYKANAKIMGLSPAEAAVIMWVQFLEGPPPKIWDVKNNVQKSA